MKRPVEIFRDLEIANQLDTDAVAQGTADAIDAVYAKLEADVLNNIRKSRIDTPKKMLRRVRVAALRRKNNKAINKARKKVVKIYMRDAIKVRRWRIRVTRNTLRKALP